MKTTKGEVTPDPRIFDDDHETADELAGTAEWAFYLAVLILSVIGFCAFGEASSIPTVNG